MPAEQHGTSDIVHSTLTRRHAVAGAFAATALLASVRSAAAQEATPASEEVSYLFLQACESGSATPPGDDRQVYDLTLQHASGQTLFFADRPERIAGIVPTPDFIDDLAAAASDPPNAVLAFSGDDAGGEVEVAVIELTSPQYDGEAGTIGYQVRLINAEQDQAGDTAEGETIAPVTELPALFGQASLFIDALVEPGQAYIIFDTEG